MKPKTAQETLTALEIMISDGVEINCTKIVGRYEITMFSSGNIHSHYQDDTLDGAILKAFTAYNGDK